MKHKHHLVPKHRGGTDADGLIECSVTRHAMFHFCEWQLHGHIEDRIAWQSLAKTIGQEEVVRAKSSLGGKKGKKHKGVPRSAEVRAKISASSMGKKGTNLGPKSEEMKKRISATMKGRPAHNKGVPMSEETKRKMSEGRKLAALNKKKAEQQNV